ncbi:hypothetical protein KIN20_006166 [Parelaphostrongylus tenuis]|uniref:Uncharacterized protein n=1 Tax=Parelaphostrongylus tenuis TaxID=148309 RepID=A0AAD5M1C8_PARTN|nr:hypothetical protein KIN20_006166 [Parelaphostrongylus tenuis]
MENAVERAAGIASLCVTRKGTQSSYWSREEIEREHPTVVKTAREMFGDSEVSMQGNEPVAGSAGIRTVKLRKLIKGLDADLLILSVRCKNKVSSCRLPFAGLTADTPVYVPTNGADFE